MKLLILGILGWIMPTFGLQAIEISRGITSPQDFPNPIENVSQCVYDGGHILLSHPSSMDAKNRFYATADLMLKASMMTIDRINLERCGVTIGGKKYSLALKAYADDSDKGTTAALITEAIVDKTDFMLAGYSSPMASAQTPIADRNSRLMITAGSAGTSVHAGKRHVFGMLPPGNSYLTNAYRATADAGAKTIAFLVDDDIPVCNPGESTKHGFEIVYELFLGENKTIEIYDEAAYNISQVDPDVMVMCTRLTPTFWITAARKHDWSPKAQVFWGNFDLEEALGTDASHMLTVSSWIPNLPPNPDVVTGWTPESFTVDFEKATAKAPDYRQVAQSAAISVLVQTLETVGSLNDTEELIARLQNTVYPTVYGQISFDENGQNNASTLLLQDDENGIPQVVYPRSLNTGFKFVYPMPIWKNRDCNVIGKCAATNGQCMEDGSCSCPDSLHEVQIGATSGCKEKENMTYIHEKFLYVGYGYVVTQCLVSAFFVAWTVWKQKTEIVKASQPIFLHLISFGCCVLSLSIIPASIQGAYRYHQDPATMQLTDTFDENILNVDMACMAFPWMFGLGFGIVFSALFAKIHRIRSIVNNASRYRRKLVKERHVMHMIAIVLAIESTIILIWTLVDPLEWNRDIISMDEDGLPSQSVGQLPILVIVTADNSVYFFVLATIVFLMSMTVTLFIFVPKVYKVHFSPPDVAPAGVMESSQGLHSKLSSAATGKKRQKSSDHEFLSHKASSNVSDTTVRRVSMTGYQESHLSAVGSEDLRLSSDKTLESDLEAANKNAS